MLSLTGARFHVGKLSIDGSRRCRFGNVAGSRRLDADGYRLVVPLRALSQVNRSVKRSRTMTHKEIRLHLSHGPHTGVAVLWDYGDRVVIGAVERGRLPPLRSNESFNSEAQAFFAARVLWLSSLPSPKPAMQALPSKRRGYGPR